MAKLYAIYSGLGGGFGGCSFTTLEEFKTQDDADDYARECAREDYQSYEGDYGILTEDECEEEGVEYEDEIDRWIDFKAVEITKESFEEIEDDLGFEDNHRCLKYLNI